ncbi:MAG: 4-(cytidine 5'-diphospho)-2-C-methyl-D-erythritol kinase [Betaproteobacteria bacterium]|nr:4-(cytidine 5'-diphospho)-2-C-methyl-D-erythritol kinase [Betaproteobacteria bacterium]MDH3436066.1 4-(cytidine 5'-diphospho)-2-C-methyl-D-erythritol kinase [Betaproteobacteria bacterium]
MSDSHAYPAPGKLNLMLRVVGRRADGYHLLQTVLRLIDYGDTLRFRVRDDSVIARANEIDGIPAADDLAVRAALLLQRATGTRLGADITLEKRLPFGGGLGGGSSDAATVLLALNQLWETRLTRARLLELGLELGADVPFFVRGENALAEGIGERLQPLALPPAWYLVLTPPVAVPTARIFTHPELKRDSKPIKMQRFSVELAGNDLESVVCREYPEVAQNLDWLRRAAPAWVTGSGACVFAAFETEGVAREVWGRTPAGMQGFIAQGLARHPLQDLAR